MPRSALVLLAPGFEEIEATCPIDLLRRAEVQVTVAAVGEDLLVTGRSELTLHADCPLSEVSGQEFDLLVLPGGPAVFELREQPRALDLIRRFHLEGRIIGAICAAPCSCSTPDCFPAPGTPPTGAWRTNCPTWSPARKPSPRAPCARSRHRGLLRARSGFAPYAAPNRPKPSANRFTRPPHDESLSPPCPPRTGRLPGGGSGSRTRKESGSSESLPLRNLRIRPARLAQPSRVRIGSARSHLRSRIVRFRSLGARCRGLEGRRPGSDDRPAGFP